MDRIDTLPEPTRYAWGVDWLTLTWPVTSLMYTEIKRRPAQILAAATAHALNIGRPEKQSRLGYTGWRLGKWYVGWRRDSAILIVSSREAGNYDRIPFLDEARCTRVDIKCDLHYAWPRPYILEMAHHMAKESQRGKRGRRFTSELHQPEGKPHWWEAGRRGGECYLKIYDKWEEQGRDPAYDGVWRIEAELQEEGANEVFHAQLLRRGGVDAIRDCGLAAFARRGIRLAGVRPGEWIDIPRSPKASDDVSVRMAWLGKVVRSSIGKLKGQVDLYAIIDILGLTEWTWENDKGGSNGSEGSRNSDSD